MYLGIDVGGTHTDAVVVDETGVRATAKIVTDHDNLLRPIRLAIETVLKEVDPTLITRLNLSTTLSTNAIVQGKTENVGVIVEAGPGVDPEHQRIGKHFYIVDGSIDHRGTEISKMSLDQVDQALAACKADGVRLFAVVGKFSTRNPNHENQMAARIGEDADFITLGHQLSGILNFPRRVASACFNSAVWRIYNDFAWAVEESLGEYGLSADVHVLKADGGTLPLNISRTRPVESILSGPAASVMGIIALMDIQEDSIILDVGGTTTDIAVFADGAPVVERDGMTVGSYPTLVRALKIRSIGVGGDSAIRFGISGVAVGPDRKGPSLAVRPEDPSGTPTLTDAMNALGLADVGDRTASIRGLEALAGRKGLDPRDLAEQAVACAVNQIVAAASDLVFDINERPVYTIHELMEGKILRPQTVYLMGGPAEALAGRLSERFGLPVKVPRHSAVANAIGAALTRTTLEIELFADTQKEILRVPGLGLSRKISKDYDLAMAEAEAKSILIDFLERIGGADPGASPDVTEAVSFNMVQGPITTGRNLRVRCQVRPGVLTTCRT